MSLFTQMMDAVTGRNPNPQSPAKALRESERMSTETETDPAPEPECGPIPDYRTKKGLKVNGLAISRFKDRFGLDCTCTPAGMGVGDIALHLNATDPRHRVLDVDGIEVARSPQCWVLAGTGPEGGRQGVRCVTREGYLHYRWELVDRPR